MSQQARHASVRKTYEFIKRNQRQFRVLRAVAFLAFAFRTTGSVATATGEHRPHLQ